MAKARSGAPTFALLITKACRLSHNASFAGVLASMLGDDFADIWSAWQSFCILWEAFLGKDDWPFQIEASSPSGPEDPS